MERADNAMSLIVTIDGPAGTGKSTVSRALAKRLKTDFLDTGAMYRAVAAWAIEHGVDVEDHEATARMADDLEIGFNWTTDPPRVLVNGEDVTDRLRFGDVNRAVSDVAANRDVRQLLVRSQRAIGLAHPNLVTEGRDQGSVVFRDAQVKFYLDAEPAIRAARRANQLREAGKDADENEILAAILYRDERDMTRAEGPLVCPQGAIRVDTSHLTQEQVIDVLYDHVMKYRAATQNGDGQ